MTEEHSTALGICPDPLDSFEFDRAAYRPKMKSVPDTSEHFTIRRQAFDNTRDARFFFPSREHAEALARCAFMVGDGNMGIGLLGGEIGCGKTLVRTVLQKKLSTERFLVLSVENCLFGFDDLLLEIVSQLHGERLYPRDLPDRYSRIAAFKDCLVKKIAHSSRHLLIILDEAQQLDARSLEALKGLTNITPERQNLFSLLLIGQPEIHATIRRLPQFEQRVGLRYHLNRLSLEDTGAYLKHRLRIAGLAGSQPFTSSAVEAVYDHSLGVPREINRIAKLALDHAIANQLPRADASIVNMVGEDLSWHDEPKIALASGL
jgi:general secretion pathway protein A